MILCRAFTVPKCGLEAPEISQPVFSHLLPLSFQVYFYSKYIVWDVLIMCAGVIPQSQHLEALVSKLWPQHLRAAVGCDRA